MSADPESGQEFTEEERMTSVPVEDRGKGYQLL